MDDLSIAVLLRRLCLRISGYSNTATERLLLDKCWSILLDLTQVGGQNEVLQKLEDAVFLCNAIQVFASF